MYSTLDSMNGRIFIGETTVFYNNCMVIGSGRGVHIESNCEFHQGVYIDAQGGEISIGKFSGVSPYSILYGHGGLKIGNYVAIAGQSMLVPGNHRFDRLDIPIRKQVGTAIGITLGDDIWIGAQCAILDGVTIGDGCVIGAGSVVTDSIPEYSVAVGVPCRVKRSRKES
ncbi:MAG: acyltransferase [Chloroflexi bacterium]|nr:acyltransferase [Chloroflexota bacterium]